MITKLSKILVIAAALSVGTNVYAYDFEADGIYYNIISSTEKTVEVTFQSLDKWGNPKSYYSGNVVIPKQVLYNNNIYSVTFINSYAFRNCSELTSVTIPSSITTIDSYAFRNCSNLEAVNISDLSAWCKINFSNTYSNPLHEAHNLYLNGLLIKNLTIPDDIAEIKDYTFYGCNCLTSVTIPDNVTSIGENVFYDCSGLTSLTIGASILSIGTSAFYNTDLTKTVWLPNTPPKGYEYVESKCNYVANESYTRLDNQTVYPYLSSMFETSGLKYVPVSPSERTCDAIDCSYDNTADIVIGKTVNYKGIEMTLLDVKGYLCYDNDSIKTLIIDGYEGNIGEEAFYDCNSLKIVNINDIKGEIGNSAFSYCPILETARLTNIGGNIGSISFYCTGLKTITITNIEGNIGEMAFYNCTSLEEVNISKVEGYIGRQAFDSCANLKTVDINDIGGEIQYQIFDGCTNLKNVTISNISGNIGESAFLDCTSLETVNLSNIGGNIGVNAFSGCTSLETVNLSEIMGGIGSKAFYNCENLGGIEIPNTVTGIGSGCFQNCSYLTYAIIGSGIKDLPEDCFRGCSSLPEIAIPATVGSIGNNVFYDCTSLARVDIADRQSVLSLGYNSDYSSSDQKPLFSDCPLDSVYIGGNISYATDSYSGYSPFYRNTSLRAVKITDQETEISENEFYGCTGLTTVELGDGIESIGDYAFSGCSTLDSFSFGYSVTAIGEEAFSDCTAMTRLESRAEVPPVCGNQALDDINKWNCTLTVPLSAVDSYKAAEQWKEFFFITGEDFDNTSGVKDAVSENGGVSVATYRDCIEIIGADNAVITVYNTNGQLVYSGTDTTIGRLARGIYVVCVGGQTFKVAL